MKKQIAIALILANAIACADTEKLAVQPSDTGEASSVSVKEATAIRWKANLFAGMALLAVVGGIVAIFVDGGTSTTAH